MSAPERSGARNLTGVWHGLYTYPDGRSTSFVATLIDAGGALSGTTHEPGGAPPSAAAKLCADLAGSRRGSAVTFTKTYEVPDRAHRSPILYDGVLSADATEIEGRWTIVGVWSGTFLMIRYAGKQASVARKEVERI